MIWLQERRRSSGTAASMLETEVGALREQSLTHVKERVALKAILDDKVRALISDIGQSVAELPIEVRGAPRSGHGAHARPPSHNIRSRRQSLCSACTDGVSTGACMPGRCVGMSAAVCLAQVLQHPELLWQGYVWLM